MLRVRVSQFGPVLDGSVSVRPLTVFVGANNSGKSYLATLLYGLFRAIGARPAAIRGHVVIHGDVPFDIDYPYFYLDAHALGEDKELKEGIAALKTWLEAASQHAEGQADIFPTAIPFESLPESIRAIVSRSLKTEVGQYVKSVARELRRCYGAEIPDLEHHGANKFGIGLAHETPNWELNISSDSRHLKHELASFSEPAGIEQDRLVRFLKRPNRRVSEAIAQDLFFDFVARAHAAFFHGLTSRSYYLPAARSGILQNHKALASFVVSRSPLAGIEPIRITPFTGIVSDFLSQLLLLESRQKGPLADIADALEADVIGGDIRFEEGPKAGYPEIYYSSKESGKMPLHRTSSMVSELAPVALFLRHVVRPNDFLVIEEPESHLHPDNQRRLAKVLVRLVRHDVRVLITTHSDFFLTQLSNYVRLGHLSTEERAARKHPETDHLLANEVGAYLFGRGPKGSSVTELAVTPEEGIPDEAFSHVISELYEETVALQHKLVQ